MKRVELEKHVMCMEEARNAYNIVVGNSHGRTLLRKPRRSLDGSIRMDHIKVGSECMNWFKEFFCIIVMNLWIP
jgi:hypothetical protein